jgi:hypothetical protein
MIVDGISLLIGLVLILYLLVKVERLEKKVSLLEKKG